MDNLVNLIRHHYTVSNLYGRIRLSILLIYQLSIQSRTALENIISQLPKRRQLDPTQYHILLGSPTVPIVHHLSIQSRTAFKTSISPATKQLAAPPLNILLSFWVHPRCPALFSPIFPSGLEQPSKRRFHQLPNNQQLQRQMPHPHTSIQQLPNNR